MGYDEMTDEEFYKKYEAHEAGQGAEAVKRLGQTRGELHEMMQFIIDHREQLGREEVSRLEQETQELLKRVKRLEIEKLVVEINTFREILALQRTLLEWNESP